MAKHDLTWDDVKKLSPDARRQVSEQAGAPPAAKPPPPRKPSAPPAQPRPKTLDERYREVVPKSLPGFVVRSTPRKPIISSVEVSVDTDEPTLGCKAFNILAAGLLVMVAPFFIWILVALLHWAWTTS